MMKSQSKAMPHPPAPSQAIRRMAWRCLPVLASLLLLGCRAGDGLPNVLYLGVEVSADETIDANLIADNRQRLGELEASYRQLHPTTRFQTSLYPEQQLEWAIRRRNRAGLGPDLLLIRGDMALRLLEAGLIAPYPQTRVDLKLFDPPVARSTPQPQRDAGRDTTDYANPACLLQVWPFNGGANHPPAAVGN